VSHSQEDKFVSVHWLTISQLFFSSLFSYPGDFLFFFFPSIGLSFSTRSYYPVYHSFTPYLLTPVPFFLSSLSFSPPLSFSHYLFISFSPPFNLHTNKATKHGKDHNIIKKKLLEITGYDGYFRQVLWDY
jgi:hypothetical protein